MLASGHSTTAARTDLPSGYGTGSGFCASISGVASGAPVVGQSLGASYDNVYACGPAEGSSWSNDLIASDFQCVELSARFLWDVYGLQVQPADGGDFVSSVHNQLPWISVGYPGPFRLPSPGDVVSLSGGPNADPSGHTAVVTSVNVDQYGNGVINVMEQNGLRYGWDHINVSNWVQTFGNPAYLNGFYYYTNVSWLELVSNPWGATLVGDHFASLDHARTGSAVIAVSDSGTYVGHSDGTSFGNFEAWSSTPFYGNRVTTFADLDGPGKPASAVAVNDSSIWVMANSSGKFGPPQLWSSVAFYGTRGTYLADLDGSGRASAVAVNDSSIWVLPNLGDHFGPPQLWSSVPFYGTRGTYLAVVDATHRASAVAVNDSSAWVLPNQGSHFGSPQLWAGVPFYGTRGTYLADVDGSGRASAVAVNDSSIWVETNSGGGGFSGPALWASGAFYGTWTYLADVDGSGRASAVAVDPGGIWVRQNTGGAFAAPTPWLTGAFYGTR